MGRIDRTSTGYDFIIIGAGVIGCLLARYLSRYDLKILLIDKESDIGMGASSANTAIIHAGYNPVPGTLKAKMNTAGNRMWDNLSSELNFTFQKSGGYVVAFENREVAGLEDILRRAKINGVTNISAVSGEEMRRREPNINPAVSEALWIPDIGICDPFGVVLSAAENSIANGVILMLDTLFEDFLFEGSRISGIKTNHGNFHSRWVVNAAGIYSDQVMHSAGVRPEFHINPIRGEYFLLDPSANITRNVMFPVPTPDTKGILVTTTTHGNVMVGPNAEAINSKEDRSTTKEGLESVWQGAIKLVPALDRRQVIGNFVGLRATGNANPVKPGVDYHHDFLVESIPDLGLVNIAGIDSPGLTSSPAMAEYVIDLLKESGEIFIEKRNWNPLRPARPRFRELDHEGKRKLFQQDCRYGHVVCRCENVTEAEILAEIHSPIPARTYDAIKRRTWLGTGRCQGAFDIPRVIKILADELGLKPEEITKKGIGSEFLSRPTKDVQT